MRRWRLVAMLFVACWAGPLGAQEPDADASAIWGKVRADLFGDADIGPGEGVVSLEIPARAQDASVVPVSIRAAFPQDASRSIERTRDCSATSTRRERSTSRLVG